MFLTRYKLFSTVSAKLRFEPKSYSIFTLVENGDFRDIYSQSGLLRTDCKILIVPRVKTRYGVINPSKLRTSYIAATKLITYAIPKPNLMKSQNTFVELSLIFDLVKKRLKKFNNTMTIKILNSIISGLIVTSLNEMVLDDVIDLLDETEIDEEDDLAASILNDNLNFAMEDDAYDAILDFSSIDDLTDYITESNSSVKSNVLLYSINLDKPIPLDFKQMKIAYIIYSLMKNIPVLFDYVVLHTVKDGVSQYKLIYDKKAPNNSYSRLLAVVRSAITKVNRGALKKSLTNEIAEYYQVTEDKAETVAKVIVDDITDENKTVDLLDKLTINKHELLHSKVSRVVTKIKKEPIESQETQETKALKGLLRQESEKFKSKEEIAEELKSQDLIAKPVELDVPEPNSVASVLDISKTLTYDTSFINNIKFQPKQFVKRAIEIVQYEDIHTNIIVIEDTEHHQEIEIVFRDKRLGEEHKGSSFKLIVPKINESGEFVYQNKRYSLNKQLVPKPIIKFKENEVLFKSFYSTFKVVSKKKAYRIYLDVLGNTNVPLFYYLCALIGPDEVVNILKLNKIDKDGKISVSPSGKTPAFAVGMIPTKETFSDFSKTFFEDTITRIMGNKYLGEYLLKDIPKFVIDDVTKKLLKVYNLPTNFIEVLLYMVNLLVDAKSVEPNDFTQRRIAITEPLLVLMTSIIRKQMSRFYHAVNKGITDITLTTKKTDLITALITENAASNIDDVPNPIAEISEKTKVSYSGFGTFSSENTPVSFRDIHISHKGQVDPIETSKGKAVGDALHLTISPTIASDGRFVSVKNPKSILGFTSSLIPFIGSSATARLNMGAAHLKQSAPVIHSEPPIVMTGYEGLYKDITSEAFIIKAKESGSVTNVTDSFIEIEYNNGIKETIQLDRGYVLSAISGGAFANKHRPLVKKGQRVKKGQILTENTSFNNGVLSVGVNLLCAFNFYNSSNFEDGIIISHEASKKLACAIIERKTILFDPNVDTIKHIIQRTGPISRNTVLLSVDTSLSQLGMYKSQKSILTLYGEDNCVFKGIIIRSMSQTLINKVMKQLPPAVKAFLKTESGHNVGTSGSVVEIELQYNKVINMRLGDKLGNRHGNKGTVTYIIPEGKTPYVKSDKRKIDAFFNPVGLINRNNWGQLKELYISAIVYKINKQFVSIYEHNGKDAAISYVSQVMAELNTVKNYDKLIASRLRGLSDKNFKELISTIKTNKKFLPVHIPPFKDIKYDDLRLLVKKYNLTEKVVCPELSNEPIDVVVGYVYFSRLVHFPDMKLNARSTGDYDYLTNQAVRGRKKGGGQSFGEMQFWAGLAHDAKNLLFELKTIHADDMKAKETVLRQIDNGEIPHLNKEIIKTNVSKLQDVILMALHLDPKHH